MRLKVSIVVLAALLAAWVGVTSPPQAHAGDGAPSLATARDAKQVEREKLVLALLGMIGSEKPAQVVKAKRLLALTADRFKQGPLAQSLTCEPASLRSFAARELGRLGDRKCVPALARVALRDRVAAVRGDAGDALRLMDDPDTVHMLGRALYSTRQEFRVRAAEALARLGDTLASPYLIARWEGRAGEFPHSYFAQVQQNSYISDFDVEVA